MRRRQNYIKTTFKEPNISPKDYGGLPLVVNIDEMTTQNSNYLRTLWTGEKMQVTLMDIKANEEIPIEIHEGIDQFIKIESGLGIVQMGKNKNALTLKAVLSEGMAIIIPSGIWHKIINTSSSSLKLFSIYSPAEHKKGTVIQAP